MVALRKESESESHSVLSSSLWPHGLYSPWNSPGQNNGVGSLSLLQGIVPTQGSNLGLPHCRWILYQLSHQGSPYQMTTPIGSFPGGATGQEPACQCRRHETWIWSLGQEHPLEKEMATHASILAWKISWTEESGRLQSIALQRVRYDLSDLAHMYLSYYLSLFFFFAAQLVVSLFTN